MAHHEHENYMFFKNLQQIARQAQMLCEIDPNIIDQILQQGHDWADDHISISKENMDQVFDFFMNIVKSNQRIGEREIVKFEDFVVELNEKKKKGLWDNIHAKRKRGEKPSKPGDDDYPSKESWEYNTKKKKDKK